MKRPLNWFIGATVIVFWVFAFGFILFATDVMRAPDTTVQRADGIVVLTGGALRIKAGIDLLEKGLARRLLITGVNPQTKKADIARVAGGNSKSLKCCVDLGYEALNTQGNADEAAAWAQQKGFRTLILVTASYHMPRSLMELKGSMPDIEIIPYPVIPKGFRQSAWWLDSGTARVLLTEYVKLFPAAVRLAAMRAFSNDTRPARDSAAATSTGAM